jgi:hypothetical protein
VIMLMFMRHEMIVAEPGRSAKILASAFALEPCNSELHTRQMTL